MVLDDEDGMTGIDELLEDLIEQDADILEMEPGGGLVEHEQKWGEGVSPMADEESAR